MEKVVALIFLFLLCVADALGVAASFGYPTSVGPSWHPAFGDRHERLPRRAPRTRTTWGREGVARTAR